MKKDGVMTVLEPYLGIKPLIMESGKKVKVQVADGNGLVLRSGQRSWPLDDRIIFQVADFAGLSKASAKGLSPKTLALAATEMIQKKERFAIMQRGEELVELAPPPKGAMIDPERAMDTILDVLGQEADFSKAMVLPEYFQLEVATYARAAVVVPGTHDKVGDIVGAGVMVKFSHAGLIEPFVQAYTRRQWCSNGACIDDVLRSYTGGEGDDVWQWFRQGVEASYNAVDGIAAKYRAMVEEGIPAADRAMVIENLIKEAKLTGEDADALRTQAIANPIQNHWDALNLLTFVTEHRMVDPRKIVRAQRAHLTFVDPDRRHAMTCPKCGKGSAEPHIVDAAARAA